ncbi:hypothetical protein OQZ33_12360 [Pedobacter sp. MC2016-05]|uniref:hypothetical protein n=1 Tax=Pedobacter sp. MC2016-05 TaxID=2994474 RepID=UPI002247577D|nr:hypothetical protein [Pedobacter sp. MC2016-05]MCX2475122.1 hypothetical protein [Pedobacter sp. MC2016-05]
MKKFTILMLCIVTLGLASCKKDTIVENTPNITLYKTIQPNQWQSNNDNGIYYYVDITDSRIEQYEDDGIILSFARFNDDGYDALPFNYGPDSYSYSSFPSRIRVYLQNNNNKNLEPTRPTASITARIVLVASSSE